MKRHITYSLIVVTSIAMVSCDFQKPKTESYLYSNEASLNRVKTNIEEAKVLSDIYIINETIISLSQLSQENSKNYRIKTISNKLEKDHLKTKKYLNNLADKKLILLPNSIDETEIHDFEITADEHSSNSFLNNISKLLKSEMAQLEYLSSITNDVDFKVLAVRILVFLEYNNDQIQNILKTNY